jgi:hypothetical protein
MRVWGGAFSSVGGSFMWQLEPAALYLVLVAVGNHTDGDRFGKTSMVRLADEGIVA